MNTTNDKKTDRIVASGLVLLRRGLRQHSFHRIGTQVVKTRIAC